jgi:hypothetical protein
MKRWSVILAAVAVGVWLVADMVHEFFANDTLGYFATDPTRLLYVGAIAIVGGLLALGFDRLSPRIKRQVRVFAWGAAASIVTVFLVWFAFSLASLSSFVIEAGGGWVAVILLPFVSLVAYLWFEFYRALKSGVSQ